MRKEEFHSLPSERLITWSEIFMLYKSKRLINTPYPTPLCYFSCSHLFALSPPIWTSKRGYPGGLPYERGGDTRRKFWIKPLKQTNLGVAQPFLTPRRDLFKLWLHESSKYNELKIYNFLYFFTCNPERPLRLNIMDNPIGSWDVLKLRRIMQ